MGILGLSSLDALITLLLIETGWWGKMFLGNALPLFVFEHFYEALLDFEDYFTFLLHLSKFLCPGILWYAFIRNQAGNHASSLKSWYWISIILDLIAIAYIARFDVWEGRLFRAITIDGMANAFSRSFIWIIGKRLVWDLSSQENDKAFFPQGFIAYVTDLSRVQVTLTVLLAAEFLFLTSSLIGTILHLNDIWGVLLPGDVGYNLLILCIVLVMLIVTLVHLIGVVKGWKAFLKFWFFAYAVLNVMTYFLYTMSVLYAGAKHLPFHFLFWLSFVINLALPRVSALALKFGVIYGSYVFIFKLQESNPADEKQVYKDEVKPLIFPPNK